MQTTIIILSVITLLALAVMTYFIVFRLKNGGDSEELLRLRTQVVELQNDLKHATEEKERIQREAEKRLQEQKVEAAANLKQTKEETDKRLQEAKEEQKRHYDELLQKQQSNAEDNLKTLREHFVEAFQNLKKLTTDATDEMLRQRQSEFTETSQKSIDTILAPLRQQLDLLQRSTAVSHKRNSRRRCIQR